MSADLDPTSSPREIRVLLVDDTDMLRVMVRNAFNRTDRYVVVAEARDGGAGIEEADRHRPDLIVLDLQMKPVSGFEALPVLRERLPEAVIVIFTGHDEVLHRQSLLAAGAAATIAKGTPLRRVIAMIDELF